MALAALSDRWARRSRGFTLIELLTVIAIIAILTAIIFPIAGTVREQARASDCLTKLHQLWVSANVYKADEGDFPPMLFGGAEGQLTADPTVHLPWDPTNANLNSTPVPADQTIYGYLYRENMKDYNLFRCPDSPNKNKTAVVKAYFPDVQYTDATQPYYWPTFRTPANVVKPDGWIGEYLQSLGCRHDATLGATEDCWWDVSPTDPLYLKPRYYYAIDAYDIGPAIDPVSGKQLVDSAGQAAYFRHYTTDWTGRNRGAAPINGDPDIGTGGLDLPFQLKYANPPDDKTLLTYCTWHAAVAHTGSVPAVSMGGTAKKLDLKQMLISGPLIYAR